MRVFCCRHGQSVANAGGATSDPLGVPLTPLGRAQAEALAQQWRDRPGLIVCSSARRAVDTAHPTHLRFPDVPLETWPIQEFTYLDPARCEGTTATDRRQWVERYWSQGDPAWCDGEGAESFNGFMGRVCSAVRWLQTVQVEADGVVLLFGHGQFINAMRWLLDGAAKPWDMQSYRAFDLAQPVGHCKPITLTLPPAHASRFA